MDGRVLSCLDVEDVYIIFLIICEICKDEKMSKSIHKGKSSGIKCNNR